MAGKAKLSAVAVKKMKQDGRKISMTTAYDYPTALLVDQAEIDILLVGDSVGTVMLGYENTVPVTVEDIIHHCKAVARAVKRTLIVGDMPFMSFNVAPDEAMRNAGRIIKQGGADVVKLEGGEEVADCVEAIVRRCGIPVMGHIGLTPQRISELGGFKVQGKSAADARNLLSDALALQEAGAFGLVLECVPHELGKLVTERVSIPTIGIGAGPDCDGQVLVLHDLLGLTPNFSPKFVKKYADLEQTILQSLAQYKSEIAAGTFPDREQHSFSMPSAALEELSASEESCP